MTRPYLIIPQLIEQPTWGGQYILELKGWKEKKEYQGKKIGQSYELTGTTLLSEEIMDSTAHHFSPNSPGIPVQHALQESETMPLLIKMNQALGNSFQLHIKPETKSDRWLPKPESWYFLEKGYVSLGIKAGIDVDVYRKTCQEIDRYMHELSEEIQSGKMTVEEAREQAHAFVQTKNPWQYINRYVMDKHSLLDLSMGAIHHSWEENREETPLGNIIYEVQLDASDDQATIRSFDQGKIKDDGTVRDMTIKDYFEHLDTDPEHNTLDYVTRKAEGEKLLRTRFYSVDLLSITRNSQLATRPPSPSATVGTSNSFHHLYVRDGDVNVMAGGVTVRVTRGHSCFIPSTVDQYVISSNAGEAVILKTFVPKR